MIKWIENLIKLYFYICEDSNIQKYLGGLRMSNNQSVRITDEEIMTIYIFGIQRNYAGVKEIYTYTKEHLSDRFPALGSYQSFKARLNKLQGCFELLANSINAEALQGIDFSHEKLLDSVPVIVAGSSRSSAAKAAAGLCSKGFCSSKNMYYYGLKLHCLGIVRAGTIPMPQTSRITPAGDNDLSAARPVLENQHNCKIYADKAYCDADLNRHLQEEQNSIILTPVKKEKGQKLKDAAADGYSHLVSRVRQPVESLFNRIIGKTKIQSAQKVRSESGLLVHVWGKFAAALFILSGFFNS